MARFRSVATFCKGVASESGHICSCWHHFLRIAFTPPLPPFPPSNSSVLTLYIAGMASSGYDSDYDTERYTPAPLVLFTLDAAGEELTPEFIQLTPERQGYFFTRPDAKADANSRWKW